VQTFTDNGCFALRCQSKKRWAVQYAVLEGSAFAKVRTCYSVCCVANQAVHAPCDCLNLAKPLSILRVLQARDLC
jgi:hypothetical protein